MDVYIDFTKKLAEVNSADQSAGNEGFRAPKNIGAAVAAIAASAGAGAGLAKSRGGVGRAASLAVQEENNAVHAETHHIVGMFSCELSKCPPSLELGLFEWEYFMKLR